MPYQNLPAFNHAQRDKIGVLVTNLGTPEAPTPKALKKYLKQFLSDPRVVEFPRILWWLILNGIILNVRPRRSAAAYKEVWTDEGSPLALITEKQCLALKERLEGRFGDRVLVEWGMRYGEPSIPGAIQSLLDRGARKLAVLPLYPQYSGSTSGSTFDAIAQDFTQRRWLPELRFVSSYHDFAPYIDALKQSIEHHWQQHGRTEKLLFSYHGVPLRYLHNGDPYHCQCHATSRLLAEKLGLTESEYLTCFQSRFGREPWLQPYTDETLKSLPKEGVKSVQVVCPGFSSDCLETIEEIGMENREYFMENGGERYEYIPALNDQAIHIDTLEALSLKQIENWINDPDADVNARDARFNAHIHNQQTK